MRNMKVVINKFVIQGNLPIADIPNSEHAMNSGQIDESQI